jgi:mevalonate kinase
MSLNFNMLPKNMEFLSNAKISANAAGKAILIGEHSVVYGYKAIAIALPDVRLQMTLIAPELSKAVTSWENAWQTFVKGKLFEPEDHIKILLVKAFDKALSLCKLSESIHHYTPQKILVESAIPLGGGMGGSAAMSTCFLKIATQIALNKNIISKELTLEQQIEYANEIDCLFHFGKASGLDVTTVASDGIIEFTKGCKHKYIKNGKEFWLALIDSQERGETALMVKGVASRIESKPFETKKTLEKLGVLAKNSVTHISTGNIQSLAKNLNLAQNYLFQLGVSTKNIDQVILKLKNAGALAAKLTGAGGGGLVLGLFEYHPKQLYTLFDKESLFITRVPVHGKN